MTIYDTHSGRMLDVQITEQQMRARINTLNDNYLKYGFITENEYYDTLFIDRTWNYMGEMIGWCNPTIGNLFRMDRMTLEGYEDVEVVVIFTPKAE